MIFVDTSVIMYAVGRPHPLRTPARTFFGDALQEGVPLACSAEVFQELMHAYLPVARLAALDDTLALVRRADLDVWPLEHADVELARQLAVQYPGLGARDLCHLASCRRRGVARLETFDRGLAAVADAALG